VVEEGSAEEQRDGVGPEGGVFELDGSENGDEVEGDLGLRDGDEHVEEQEGSVYDEVEDRGRRECSRCGNGSAERPVSTSLRKEEGMRTAMRSKAEVFIDA
jgi:hypothetical protein